jgi:hypothetical protein
MVTANSFLAIDRRKLKRDADLVLEKTPSASLCARSQGSYTQNASGKPALWSFSRRSQKKIWSAISGVSITPSQYYARITDRIHQWPHSPHTMTSA